MFQEHFKANDNLEVQDVAIDFYNDTETKVVILENDNIYIILKENGTFEIGIKEEE